MICAAEYPATRMGLCGKCREKKFKTLWCPPLYWDTNEGLLPKTQFALAKEWRLNPIGLMLVGPSGSGKTRVAWQVLRRVLVDDVFTPTFGWFDCVSFGHHLARHYREDDAENWLDRVANHELLFFDDLGKMKLTERAEAELFGVIERRCAYKRPTIVTTNETGETLAARMTDDRGPALIRRLREFSKVIVFDPKTA